MSDIVNRAEQRINDAAWCRACKVEQPPFPADLLSELVAELKAARAERDAWQENAEHYEWSAGEVNRLDTELKVARAAEEKIAAILLLLANPLEFYREAIEYAEVGDEYIEEITKMLISPDAMFEVVKILAGE